MFKPKYLNYSCILMGSILTKSASDTMQNSTSVRYVAKKIDDTIEKQIYYPPNTPESDFLKLNTEYSRVSKLKTPSGDIVPMVIIGEKWSYTKCIVWTHGNATDISKMFDYFCNLAENCNTLVVGFDYVGYGLSRKTLPTEQGCYDSLTCVMNHLMNDINIKKENIYLVGHSIGTGVVADYIYQNNWTNPVMLISPYKTIARIMTDSSIVAPIDKFTSMNKLNEVICPVKILHGEADALIHISHGKELFNNLKNKSLKPTWLPEIGHNDILQVITTDHFNEVLNYTPAQ